MSEDGFASFDFDDRLHKAVLELGWTAPTRVQAAMIPLVMEGKNVVARARTGSGKTAAFLLPIIQRVLQAAAGEEEEGRAKGPLALIVAPTKELANQIYKTVAQLTANCVFLQTVNFAQFADDRGDDTLREMVDIAVSTPARLLSVLRTNPSLLAGVEHVVLDEADLLFSYGYREEMRRIKEALPPRYQTVMTSATLNEEMGEIKSMFVVGPLTSLKLKEGSLPGVDQLTQYHILSANDEERFSVLLALIKLKLLVGRSVIFVASTDRCYKLHLFFETFEIPSCVLNSQMPANYRYQVIQEFNQSKYPYIIASECEDIYGREEGEEEMEPRGSRGSEEKPRKKARKGAFKLKDKESGIGRGIDFHSVSNVINFDFPTSTEMYIHRVGRTARGWNKGTAISFVVPEEQQVFKIVQRQISEQMKGPVLQPYEVRMKDFESFQLRAREALAACTKSVIRETRLAEIRRELVNSKQLEAYFRKNPREREALEQDRKRHKLNVHSSGIANIPSYMVPPSLRGRDYGTTEGMRRNSNKRKGQASGEGIKKRAHSRKMTTSQKKHQKKMADPLQSFKF